MRILEIQIERFGAWQNLNLPMADGPLSVFFGPNEAGKTTLMRFVRGILFGYAPRVSDIWGEEIARLPRSGSLKVLEDNLNVRLHRCSLGTNRGELTLTGLDQPRTAQDWLHDALRGVNEKLFENVYAIGLKELQELGSLTDEDVSGHIYGLSLGPEARRLLDSWHRVHREREALVDKPQTGGRLIELYARQDDLLGQLATFKKLKPRYSALCQQRGELEAEIDALRDRQGAVVSNLRGLRFLAASWQPWKRIRHLEQELQTLPVIDGFPERGVARLEKIESEIAAASADRNKYAAEAKGFKQRLAQLTTSGDLRKHASAMQGLLDQRVVLADLAERIRQADERVAAEELRLSELRSLVGSDWSQTRVDHADISASAHHRMADVASKYRSTGRALARRRRAMRKFDKKLELRRSELVAGLAPLHGRTIDEEVAETRRHLDNLKKIARLELHEAELEDRQVGIEDDLARMAPRAILPQWVYFILSLFCFAGLILSANGLYQGWTHSGLAGATWACLGLACTLIAWAFKRQFEGDAKTRMTEIESESRANLAELEQIRIQLSKITGRTVEEEARSNTLVSRGLYHEVTGQAARDAGGTSKTGADQDDKWYYSGDGEAWNAIPKSRRKRSFLRRLRRFPGQVLSAIISGPLQWEQGISKFFSILFYGDWSATEADTAREQRLAQRLRRAEVLQDADTIAEEAFGQLDEVQTISRKLVDLERLSRTQIEVDALATRRLVALRKTRTLRREHRAARLDWREFLKQTRFPENLSVRDAETLWRKLVDAREQRSEWKAGLTHLENLRDLWNTWTQRIEELGHRLQDWDVDYSRPLEVLGHWERKLALLAKHRGEHRENRGKLRGRIKEARGLARRIDECRVQRNALLTQGGSANRDEFLNRAGLIARRYELERELANTRRELQDLCRGYEDLALVEEDLLRFDAFRHDETARGLEGEQSRIERDLALALDQLGGIKHDIALLEDDDAATRLRFDLARCEDDIRSASEEWFGLELSAQIVDGMRSRYERTCQPRALIEASKFLERLTQGRYHNIWTPLGEKHLLVDDRQGRSIPVELLSSGTREQLFLAIRLAVVQDLGRQGIRLPMILDDVFVNFDQQRAAVAAKVLMDFAAEGHQLLLFTCHQHLADAFEELGVPPTRLPARKPQGTMSDSERRLAG
jgi:uncharacterized protein YhaN